MTPLPESTARTEGMMQCKPDRWREDYDVAVVPSGFRLTLSLSEFALFLTGAWGACASLGVLHGVGPLLLVFSGFAVLSDGIDELASAALRPLSQSGRPLKVVLGFVLGVLLSTLPRLAARACSVACTTSFAAVAVGLAEQTLWGGGLAAWGWWCNVGAVLGAVSQALLMCEQARAKWAQREQTRRRTSHDIIYD